MKFIYQKGEGDCGVAALAMLSDRTYDDAFAYLKGTFNRTRQISSKKILDGIRHFGGYPLTQTCEAIGTRRLYDLEWNALLDGDLLIDGKWSSHWAVWDAEAQTIRDPYGYVYPYRVRTLVEISWP